MHSALRLRLGRSLSVRGPVAAQSCRLGLSLGRFTPTIAYPLAYSKNTDTITAGDRLAAPLSHLSLPSGISPPGASPSLRRHRTKFPIAAASPGTRVLQDEVGSSRRHLSTSSSSSSSTSNKEAVSPPASTDAELEAEPFLDRVWRKLGLLPEQSIAPEGFNRWLLLPAAMTNHLCLVSVCVIQNLFCSSAALSAAASLSPFRFLFLSLFFVSLAWFLPVMLPLNTHDPLTPLSPPSAFNSFQQGTIFGWSILNEPLTRLEGVLTPAAVDWGLSDIAITFSLVMGGFVWAGFLGKYVERWGPRVSCLIGSAALGSGFGLGALAIATHSLPLLYVGGAVWGLANGWAYVPPVATLLKWFPDRKGFASGSCILGFGGGAMVAAPIFTYLLDKFSRVPKYLGHWNDVDVINEGGKLFAKIGETLQEVIVATHADVKALEGVQEGIYAVGTGSTGAAGEFIIPFSSFCISFEFLPRGQIL